jgi:hypothetical protein
MRDIKFRGKAIGGAHPVRSHQHAKDGEWLYGDLAQGKDKGVMWVDTWHVIPSTVGQYTGLKDKCGNEIYEGDILRVTFSSGAFYEQLVIWENGGFVLGGVYISAQQRGGVLKIIGNIHDCPEMLEREK